MKKGLSKILSLACVFALLMTMAIPAFAAGAAEEPENKASITGKFDGITFATSDGNVELVEYSTQTVKYHANKADTTGTDKDYKTYGVFVQENSKVRFYPIKNEVIAATDTDATKVQMAKVEGTKVEFTLDDYVTGMVKIGDKYYVFDNYGYLEIGDSNGVYIYTDKYGDTHQIVLGKNAVDDETRDKVMTTPRNFEVWTGTGVHKNANYTQEEIFIDSNVKAKVAEAVESKNQIKNSDGIIQLMTGPITMPEKTDGYGNKESAINLYAYAEYKETEKVPDAALTGTISQVKGGSDGKIVKAVLTLDDDKKPDTVKSYALDKKNNVLVDDGEGNNIVKLGKKFYLTKDDGSLYTNDTEAPYKSNEKPNVWKIDGVLKDFGQEVTIKIGAYDQKFYIPANKAGETGAAAIMTNDYRYLPNANGTDWAGLTYYNPQGITYAGWVLADGKGDSRTLKYQTIIKETGDYILVAGQQYLDAGADPEDLSKTIPAGFYLFDENGTLVKGAKTVKMYGKTYVLNADNTIKTVDGKAPTL